MTDSAKLRTITTLSAAWDGEPIKKARAEETTILYGRRVGMHLMVQPEVANRAFADELLTKQGFMSRILTCLPNKSDRSADTQGFTTRSQTDARKI
jgi:hypothetical protein